MRPDPAAFEDHGVRREHHHGGKQIPYGHGGGEFQAAGTVKPSFTFASEIISRFTRQPFKFSEGKAKMPGNIQGDEGNRQIAHKYSVG